MTHSHHPPACVNADKNARSPSCFVSHAQAQTHGSLTKTPVYNLAGVTKKKKKHSEKRANDICLHVSLAIYFRLEPDSESNGY